MRSPSAWKSPLAYRRQVTSPVKSLFAGDMIHTSPLHVLIATRPSLKKSNPPGRIHELLGFVKGNSTVFTTYASCSPGVPAFSAVFTGSFECAGPPLVKGARSCGFVAPFAAAMSFASSAAVPLAYAILKFCPAAKAGSCRITFDPFTENFAPCGSPMPAIATRLSAFFRSSVTTTAPSFSTALAPSLSNTISLLAAPAVSTFVVRVSTGWSFTFSSAGISSSDAAPTV